jgi:hypothetical protein
MGAVEWAATNGLWPMSSMISVMWLDAARKGE